MATLLAGDSGHYSYAPLSQGQTMSICQHLESMIRELRSQFGEMRRDLTNTDSTMAQVRNSLGSTNASVQGLQEAQVVSTNAVDTLKRDVDRTGNKVNKLGVNLESVADVCNSLKESQKVMKISYQQLKQGLATLTERANHVDKVLESSQAGIHTELREQLQHAMVGIKGLRDDHQCTKSSTQELREGLRSTNGRVQGLGEDINKITTHAGLMEHRLGEACVNLKATRQSLAETNAVALKSHEDHRQTKANLGFTQEGVKKCASHVKQLHEAVDLATTKLNNTQDQAFQPWCHGAATIELASAEPGAENDRHCGLFEGADRCHRESGSQSQRRPRNGQCGYDVLAGGLARHGCDHAERPGRLAGGKPVGASELAVGHHAAVLRYFRQINGRQKDVVEVGKTVATRQQRPQPRGVRVVRRTTH